MLIDKNIISNSTKIIESSSGNFAISLAGICSCFGLSFTCVKDPLISPISKTTIELFGGKVITVSEPDENNIYVEKRLEFIKDLIQKNSNIFWINQYDNYLVREAYSTLGEEILRQKMHVDYIFLPVSSCGTIAGVSTYIKSINPLIKIIAVDLNSSSIFNKPTTKQKLPGMGFYKPPGNYKYACIDDFVIVDEVSCIIECRKLVNMGVWVGPSSGGVAAAICKYKEKLNGKEVVGVFPDRGDRYISTVFNDKWCSDNYPYLTNLS